MPKTKIEDAISKAAQEKLKVKTQSKPEIDIEDEDKAEGMDKEPLAQLFAALACLLRD